MKRLIAFSIFCCLPAPGADWPEWRGAGRRGVWTESGIVDSFPAGGLAPIWRVPVRAGYAGPAVSGGRVFVTDYADGVERALAFEETSGRTLWIHEWTASYRGLDYGSGPRATPTVDGDRVYVLGAVGHLWCLDARTGAVVWKKHFPSDYGTQLPGWGTANAPLVVGERLIAVAGGRPNAKVVAFDKRSGKELWRALSGEESEQGYSQPVLQGGRVILFHSGAVSAFDAGTGRVLWEHPWRITFNTPIATPTIAGPHVLVAAFFQGARLLKWADGELVWKGNGTSEISSDTIHALMNSPVVDGDYIYGVCAYGQLRCLKLATGERVWESQQATVEKTRNVSAWLVRNGERYFIYNDRGELILARLKPAGYEELGRTKLLKPTSPPGGRRQLGAVNWTHPAFANRHILVRNDEELVRFPLASGPR